MSDVAIRVEKLGKQYKIGRLQKRNDTLRDALASRVSQIANHQARSNGDKQSAIRDLPSAISNTPSADFIWALRDVSFEVKRGEVVGIIGRNGAGKSTLLKILSRITEPTTGTVDLYGRVGSLLEVGTGFHPELTGRENIFLNGAILGMRKAEIEKRFNEIVAFAEVEKFIDTPVKRYSSGMYVRLAFAVAAHLEPEILVVDEVLAVGDADFQKKSLGKVQSVGENGRVVLFVSHSMPMISRLCKRVILLNEGKLLADGPAYEVIRYYQKSGLDVRSIREWDQASAPGNEIVRMYAVRVSDNSGVQKDEFEIQSPVNIEIEYELLKDKSDISVQVGFYNNEGLCLFITQDTNHPEWHERLRTRGLMQSTLHIPPHFFAEGEIYLNVLIVTVEPTEAHVHERDVVGFTIVDHTDGEGVRGKYAKYWPGFVRPLLDWSIQQSTSSLD